MSRKHWSADRHGVTQWFADGQRVGVVRNPRMTFAIAVAVVLVAAVVAVTASTAFHSTNTANTTAANNRGRFGGGGDLATAPVDGAGNAISLNQTAAQAAASLNCTLVVPANPLTAPGLATPWQLADGCVESNTSLQAFVEATILSPAGQLSVYNPLVVTQGTQPAAAPIAPTIAAGSQVIINIGFNGTNLALTGAGAPQGNCVDALGQSVFGQVSACNAAAFYRMANAQIAQGTLKIPAAGTATDGKPCLTTRDFGVIDQDQSDNVVSQYLLNANGQTAQNTAANKAAMPGSSVIINGSDDALLAAFVDPATGCTPLTATDPTNPNGTAAAQALNELSARVNQQAPIALVPTNDEMTLVNGQFSVAKTNAYRALVDQTPLAANTNATQVAATYCQDMVNIQPARSQLDAAAEAGTGSPVPAVGSNLANFLGNRLSMSFTNLNCGNFGLTDPTTVTTDGNGVATAVTYNTAQQTANVNGTAACASPTASATASASPTASATVSASPTASATVSAPATASASPTVSAPGTASASPTVSAPATASASPTVSAPATASASPTASAPATQCATPTPTAAPSPTSRRHRHNPRNGSWQNPSNM